MDSYLIARHANDAQPAGGCARTLKGALGAAIGPEHCADRSAGVRGPEPRQPSPFCHDGTERRIQRPTDTAQQKSHYSGKKKCHTVKNVVLVEKHLSMAFLSPTHPGTMHDKRSADATPYPLPPGSHLLQDRGFLAFSLEGVILQQVTAKKPTG